jgi:hypothetical protein
MTTTPRPALEELNQRIADLRDLALTTDDGERGRVCTVDGYPSVMDCTCGDAHNRHVGKAGSTRCMSYVGRPDCPCTAFVPAPADVAQLWEAHSRLLRALDVEKVADLVPALPRSWRRRFAVAVVASLVGAP